MKIHLIAIGGAAMHNMAIALSDLGHEITGSDDEIFDPSKSRLANKGLLPKTMGWNPDAITEDIDVVILGMHARIDNPELLKAQEMGLRIVSYPEYVFEEAKDKKRVVIGGSHGKTTVTSMILHVLNHCNIPFDYLVGSQLPEFDCMVQFSDAEIMVIEGDEYLSSPIDRRPKFHWYKPDVAVLTGIAWDHINVFPTYENYLEQFSIFGNHIEPDGSLIYFDGDEDLSSIVNELNCRKIKYNTPNNELVNEQLSAEIDGLKVDLKIFGAHNLQNMMAAYHVCKELGVSRADFANAISQFTGAAKRLEQVYDSNELKIYKDFAHSPSKLKATTKAIKSRYPDRFVTACMELHTFSSLKKEFLPHYKDSMKAADKAIVYYSPEVVKHKKLEPVSVEYIQECFGGNITVVQSNAELIKELQNHKYHNDALLMMSSGNFGGLDLNNVDQVLSPH